MTWITYLGEHPAVGTLGQASLALAFVTSILAAYAGWRGTQEERAGVLDSRWSKLTGASFAAMGVGILVAAITLFTIMTQRYYEYQYVQAHVSDDLPFRYIFTGFWEGQEGSLTLWVFWQSVLGGVIWLTAGPWRTPVLAVIASVQAVLLSMLQGIYLPIGEGFKLGSSPFLLLRDVIDAPIFSQADYVGLLDGKGISPLLQNYWMIIHPPTLFLGFASTVVPFAFAAAGLWLADHKGWLRPALRWSLFSAGILGIGILMGGAWAYEALNFGGYWAWDPVENTSLVPWLLLVAGIHTNLVAKATGHSIRSTYAFYILGFVGVLYSSYLTRSGALGETSVHAFTEMGLGVQLSALVGIFVLLGLGLLAWRWRGIPTKQQEETVGSREFWMFLGSLVLLFSAGMITASTSLPVVNKIGDALGLEFGHLTINDPVEHYNKYQLWVGVFMGTFTAIGQYLRWRGRSLRGVTARAMLVRMGAGAGAALVLAVLTGSTLATDSWQFTALAFAGYYALIANLDYLVTSNVSLWQRAGSVSAHVGFGMLLIGVLFSGLNQHQISQNSFAMEGLLDKEMIGKNVLLLKDLPMVINGYEVTYLSDSLKGNRRDFQIRYREMSPTGEFGNEFVLSPYVLYTNDFEKIASANPDTKHYWDHDVFTHITGLDPSHQSAEQAQAFADSLDFERYELPLDGKPASTGQFDLAIEEVIDDPEHSDYEPEGGDLALGVKVRVTKLDSDTTESATAVVVLRENLIYSYPAQINSFNARIQVPEDALAARFASDQDLDYRSKDLAPGDTIRVGTQTVTFTGFDRAATHPNYVPEEGDVAVNAVLDLRSASGATATLEPLYYIRGTQPEQLKAHDRRSGIHARLAAIDPGSGKATILIAQEGPSSVAKVPVEIAENASRSDYVVLEATVFPGINLFWAGSILMLLGLLISMGFRISEKRARGAAIIQDAPLRRSARPKPVEPVEV